MGEYSTNPYGKTSDRSSKSNTGVQRFARVLDIILDETHPKYRERGGSRAINGIFFKYLRKATSSSSEDKLYNNSFAYYSNSQIKTIPIVGEIVSITTQPSSKSATSSPSITKYYTKIVNIWNNPNSNTLLDTLSDPFLDTTCNGDFTEESTVNPIRSAVGDLQIEGRQGQSMRFTGAKGSANSFVDDTNKGAPAILISNGQIATDDGFTAISEDINIDDSSLYFVANHSIPLTQANYKRKSYDTSPVTADEYKGNQVLLNSGRIFFNAKEKDILLSSVESVGINSEGSVNIDAESYMCIDAPGIYLGEKARTAEQSAKEPVLLGNQTEILLNILLNTLTSMAKDMASATTVDGKSIPLLNKRGVQMLPMLETLQGQINPTGPSKLKSKKVFTE